jgi:hypothetical protein
VSNTQIQCKYLEAGAKSSPVVFDASLSTSNDLTIYLYHQLRDQIIEYRRDIVEAKLRDLNGEEEKGIKALQQAYQKARAGFSPRGAAALEIPEKAAPQKAAAARNSTDESEDEGDDDIGLIDDDDLLDEEVDED